uniref:hypothetical protein n=1 Tax=Kitasatospora indigofera TaxID=67307 RepID=UPI002F90B312
MTHPDHRPHRDVEGTELCDLCGTLVDESEAYLSVVADSSATATDRGGGLMDGERLLTACCWDHLETLVYAYEQRIFDIEELWAAIFVEAHRRLGLTATTDQILRATGLTPHQLDRARDWHTHHRLLPHRNLDDGAAS